MKRIRSATGNQDYSASRPVLDEQTINEFNRNPTNPYLVSFPRTGSHWLRMLIELYFEQPTLVRTFYYHTSQSYLLLHTHDLDLDVQRSNVIYLYREPVATVFSQMHYHAEDLEDRQRIMYWATLYGQHLYKWLHEETFTSHKTLVTYEGMRRNLPTEFNKITDHFNVPFDNERLSQIAARLTKEEVKRKTPHDGRVMQLGDDYEVKRSQFVSRHTQFLWDMVLKNREVLTEYIEGPQA